MEGGAAMIIPRNANDCRKAKRALRIEIGWNYAPLDFDGAAITRADPERFDSECDRLAAWLEARRETVRETGERND